MLVKLEKPLVMLAVLLFVFSTAVHGVASGGFGVEHGRPELGDGKGIEVKGVHDGEGYWLNIEGNKPQFKFKYISGGEVQDQAQFRVRFDRVVEYFDENQSGFIDNGEELFEYKLIPMAWDYIVKSVTMDSNDGWKVTLSTNDSINDGSFVMNITLWLFEDETKIGENTVDWLTIKIDLTFISIPWKNSNSNLALKVDLTSEYDLKQESEPETSSQTEGEVSTTGTPQIYFSWDNQAQIYDSGGNFVDNVPVNATVLMPPDSKGKNKLYLCYPNFGSDEILVHDPVICVRTNGGGYLTQLLGGGYLTQLLIGIFAVVGVCVVLFALHRRGKAL